MHQQTSGRKPFTRVLPAVLLAAFGLAGAAPSAGAAVFGTQGIAAGPKVAQATTDRGLDLAARTGAKLLRVPAQWSSLEPKAQGERDPAALAALDGVVDGASARGLKVVLVIAGTPCWASAAPAKARRSCTGSAANRDDVTRFRPRRADSVVPIATFLASRYASRLAAFQIWNEPDQANEKYWAGSNKVKTYVAMVKALYGPLKQAAPGVPVLAGSFVGANGRWLQAMYDRGVKGFYDGMAVQFYGPTLYALRATRAVQLRNGDKKPLWLTEFGYTDCYRKGGPARQIDQLCVTSSAAAQGMKDILTAINRRSWIAAAIQYELFDAAPGGYTFGLADRRGKPKSTYFAVRQVLTGRSRAPRRPTVRVRTRRGRVSVTGTASLSELLTVRVEQRGTLRFRARLVADRRGRWKLSIPAVLGTRGLTVRVSAGYTGTAVGRS